MRKAPSSEKGEANMSAKEKNTGFHLNQIKPTTNVWFNILFAILSFVCIFPVIYVFMISISSESTI